MINYAPLQSTASIDSTNYLSNCLVYANKIAINIFILFSSVYILTSSGNTTDVTSDAIIRFEVTRQIIDHGRFDLAPGGETSQKVKGIDGLEYSPHGIGQSALAIPFYLAGRWLENGDEKCKLLISLMGPITSAFSCVVFFYLALQMGYTMRTAVMLTLITGLCTHIWPESKSPFDHHLETFFILICTYLVYVALKKGPLWKLSFAGIFLGMAILTRFTTILWILPLVMLMAHNCWQKRRRQFWIVRLFKQWTILVLGMMPFLCFLFYYNVIRFGSLLEAGYGVWAKERNIDNFNHPLLDGLFGLLISPGKGVLIYCPLLFLFIFTARHFYQKHIDIGLFTFASSAIYLYLFGKYIAWHGDAAWGPRYLTFLIPFWMLPLGVIFEDKRHRKLMIPFIKPICWILIIVSFFIQFGAVAVDMNAHFFKLQRMGIISDNLTYTYPDRLYFNWKYSPLTDRALEIWEMFEGNLCTDDLSNNKLHQTRLFPDFWWAIPARRTNALSMISLLCAGLLFSEVILCCLRIRKMAFSSRPKGMTREPVSGV